MCEDSDADQRVEQVWQKEGGGKAQEWMFHDGMTDNETMS